MISVLILQYATGRDDLVNQVLKIFGFSKTSDKSRARIRKVIGTKVDEEELVVLANGMIDVRK